jgi:hypothetical protein
VDSLREPAGCRETLRFAQGDRNSWKSFGREAGPSIGLSSRESLQRHGILRPVLPCRTGLRMT